MLQQKIYIFIHLYIFVKITLLNLHHVKLFSSKTYMTGWMGTTVVLYTSKLKIIMQHNFFLKVAFIVVCLLAVSLQVKETGNILSCKDDIAQACCRNPV